MIRTRQPSTETLETRQLFAIAAPWFAPGAAVAERGHAIMINHERPVARPAFGMANPWMMALITSLIQSQTQAAANPTQEPAVTDPAPSTNTPSTSTTVQSVTTPAPQEQQASTQGTRAADVVLQARAQDPITLDRPSQAKFGTALVGTQYVSATPQNVAISSFAAIGAKIAKAIAENTALLASMTEAAASAPLWNIGGSPSMPASPSLPALGVKAQSPQTEMIETEPRSEAPLASVPVESPSAFLQPLWQRVSAAAITGFLIVAGWYLRRKAKKTQIAE